MKPKHSHSPDGYTQFFLRELRDAICCRLAHIFEQSFINGVLPSSWLCSDLVPLFKKGDACNASNYRPISLLSSCCKLMESIVNDSLVGHLKAFGLICSNQHGFVSKKSTTTQLLECLHEWTQALDNKIPVDVIYIDFAKAFDTVSHKKLIHKMSKIGIQGSLLKWIQGRVAIIATSRPPRIKWTFVPGMSQGLHGGG